MHHFFAPCPRGLEAALKTELEELGAKQAADTPGGVAFTGPFEFCYKANLHSRIASRILWRVSQGSYRNEQDIYEHARAMPWHTFFAARHTIKVKVSAQNCPLKSLEFVTLRIKDAVCDRFRDEGGSRPSVNTSTPDIRIDAFLERQSMTIYLDTSGEALFKRGRRASAVEAPLRENLAAGILRLTGWSPDQPLLDPMCGSGTFLMEAALIARHIPPGLGRHFAFEKLRGFDTREWQALCTTKPAGSAKIYGSDIDAAAIRSARENLKGLDVSLHQANVLDIKPPGENGILVANPPYGERIGDKAELAALYPKLGDVLKQKFAGWKAYFFTTDLRLPKLIGLHTSRRTPLFNGALECRLFEYKLY